MQIKRPSGLGLFCDGSSLRPEPRPRRSTRMGALKDSWSTILPAETAPDQRNPLAAKPFDIIKR